MELQDKVVLVTGAAVRVGKGIALALAAEGARLVLHYFHSEAPARELADEMRTATGQRAELVRADLADPAQIRGMFDRVADRLGRLDALVNNAANYDPTPLDDLDPAAWDRNMAVNVRGPALCISGALPLMRDGGAIVNITDITALKGRAEFAGYCASKAALLSLTRSAAKALAERGIRVNAVAPGVALWPEGASEQHKDSILAKVPLHRPGSPQDVADAVIFLIRSDYITGHELCVDGGWSIA